MTGETRNDPPEDVEPAEPAEPAEDVDDVVAHMPLPFVSPDDVNPRKKVPPVDSA
jgi:hypothetical protein